MTVLLDLYALVRRSFAFVLFALFCAFNLIFFIPICLVVMLTLAVLNQPLLAIYIGHLVTEFVEFWSAELERLGGCKFK